MCQTSVTPKTSEIANDEIISETVKIIRGQFKGTMGQAVEATDTHEKVELHSKMKIAVGKNQVKVVGDNTGCFL